MAHPVAMSEAALEALLELVRGLGYMHTYPRSDATIHNGCIELERRGLLRREMDQPHHVCWVCKTVRPRTR